MKRFHRIHNLPIISSIFLFTLCSNALTLQTCLAENKVVHKTHDQRINKARAEMQYTNRGTKIYNYQEIDKYSDSLVGDKIGIIDFEKEDYEHVREVNNSVIIKDDVDSEKDYLGIGVVEANTPGRVKKINNDVTITGDINADGEDVEIGIVRVEQGSVESVNNTTKIEGKITID
ncbi:MAG: hypothetical protein Q7U64_05740 [Desulfocapsaceae bacterium]|nr:hypothetical protein [Desulfocapsaceae bacterium]